jgi:DNA-binding transcriptional regulator YiaG
MKKWHKEDIRKLRDRLKLTQRAFADLLGVTENYVYLLERGVRIPSKTLELLLDCIEKEKGKGGEKAYAKKKKKKK